MEFPQKLGLLQEVEYSYNGRQYEGILKVEGCRRGVCLRYKVLVTSKNGSDWEPAKRRRSELDLGGCLKQAAADALMELADRYQVGIWYNYEPLCSTCGERMTLKDCGVEINGIRLRRPYCSNIEDCISQILEDYRRKVEALKETPMKAQIDDATKFLNEHQELQIFGIDWIREWLPYARERMIQIAEILKNHPKAKKAIEQFGIKENPLVIEIYISKDGTEECVAFGSTEVFCVSENKMKKTSLEYIGQMQPRGLLAYVPRKEFIRVL